MTTYQKEQEQFKQFVDEIHEFNIVLYALLYKAPLTWSEKISTACVSAHKGRIQFTFNPVFWNSLTTQEQMFLILHECYHVFLYHFERFNTYDYITNYALDVAVNHSILRHFTINESQLPHLRKYGCWCDTVIPNEVLMDNLSAEEYLFILRKKLPPDNGLGFDIHTSISPEDMDEIKKQLEEDLTDLLPEKNPKQIKDLISQQLDPQSGLGRSSDKTDAHIIEKRKKTWIDFAKYLQKTMFRTNEHYTWLPHKRLRHLESNGLCIPSTNEVEIFDKINVVILLDTSGSCDEYRHHFLGFARALPKEFFEVHLFGFHDDWYKIDINNPEFEDGGTSFSFFQTVFDKVPGKKIAFVFTDGRGTLCKLNEPHLWNWFLYQDNSRTDLIPNGCKIHKLEDFE